MPNSRVARFRDSSASLWMSLLLVFLVKVLVFLRYVRISIYSCFVLKDTFQAPPVGFNDVPDRETLLACCLYDPVEDILLQFASGPGLCPMQNVSNWVGEEMNLILYISFPFTPVIQGVLFRLCVVINNDLSVLYTLGSIITEASSELMWISIFKPRKRSHSNIYARNQ